jgi:hypothetical protein
MPVPSSGPISLGKIGNEVRATSTANDYNEGPYTTGATGLWEAENSTYGNVNQHNPSGDRPNLSQPASMSEWYSYDHLHPSN